MQIAMESEQILSDYVSIVDAGEDIVITKAGRPVARIIADQPGEAGARQAAAAERLISLYTDGYELGGLRIDRDDLYDRAH